MNKQKDVRKHIAAARGWLSQADDSLEQDNDIQGDLKLMLAHAELQRAQEKNGRKACVRWFKRLAPPIVACLLALGGILYMQWGWQEQAAERSAADTVPVHSEAQPIQAPQENTEDVIHGNSLEAVPPTEQPQADIQNMEVEVKEEIHTDISESEQPKQEPQVPDGQLQKLMQSAGSILRE